MNKTKITSLYDRFKNTNKKLKIVCDWDEVIQSAYPYACWLGEKEQKRNNNTTYCVTFVDFFDSYWHDNEGYYRNENPSDIYHRMPFLTIAEGLLRLLKEDKIEKLIFLSTSDDRKIEVFEETFRKLAKPTGNFMAVNDKSILGGKRTIIANDIQLHLMTDFLQCETKAEWIEKYVPDFDIFIDDDPKNCRDVLNEFISFGLCRACRKDKKKNCVKCPSETTAVLAPYYPILERKHDKRVLFIKNEVSNLKKEDFDKS